MTDTIRPRTAAFRDEARTEPHSGIWPAISTETVLQCVGQAFDDARRHPISATTAQHLHAGRSRHFVAALGEQLGALYVGHPDVRVFTKHDDRNRTAFGMNELLYDVTVCRTATVSSAANGKRLHYVTAPVWHVESELAKDSRQALFDFNKLVLGAAALNLFVGPLVHDVQEFLNVLRVPASCCLGSVYVALIPHPSDWDGFEGGVICEELT